MFAWCGGAVLLSVRYLREVGIFDDRYFMYYEDTDLSWRGRLAGWRYRYVPDSVVRHEHAASSKEGSPLFQHFVERNRFLTLARNAPWPMFSRGVVRVPARHRGDLQARRRAAVLRHRSRPSPRFALRRLRAYAGLREAASRQLATRRRQASVDGRRAELVDRWGRVARPMRVAVYNAHWATLGGGEQLAGGAAAALARAHDVELLVDEPFDAIVASERLGFDLTRAPAGEVEPRHAAPSSRRPPTTTSW